MMYIDDTLFLFDNNMHCCLPSLFFFSSSLFFFLRGEGGEVGRRVGKGCVSDFLLFLLL